MQALIANMMRWANVSEERLQKKKASYQHNLEKRFRGHIGRTF